VGQQNILYQSLEAVICMVSRSLHYDTLGGRISYCIDLRRWEMDGIENGQVALCRQIPIVGRDIDIRSSFLILFK
jgi:hypothetical protein